MGIELLYISRIVAEMWNIINAFKKEVSTKYVISLVDNDKRWNWIIEGIFIELLKQPCLLFAIKFLLCYTIVHLHDNYKIIIV